VTDALDVKGKPFGLDGIHNTLSSAKGANVTQLVDRLAKAVQAHATGRDPFDDITLVGLGRLA
jgi:serine phosphatase RsbU (regulator of sigma subunit)